MTNFLTSTRLAWVLEFIFHPLSFLVPWTNQFNYWGYVVLFTVLFLESAYLLFSFLPAQSLLFVAGAISANRSSVLNIYLLLIGFAVMTLVGSTIKYRTGIRMKARADAHIQQKRDEGKSQSKTMKRLSQSEVYFEKYGGSFLIIARFVPIVGLFMPLIAGETKMDQRQFHLFNTIGVVAWILIATLAGFFFGKTQFVKNYFTFICIGIALLPIILHEVVRFVREWVDAIRDLN
ncbi:MAG: VTT domain-containing protein [Furfurilactobacillus sp.]|jgi:membrane-associated protein|uniref:VTT domain-containing protein n=1 Tax=Furfurilactobacillus milii TaxID=2888272 RepID=A0ABT6DB92_9LACO|nr:MULTISPECIES: VTT domain-containing protein [Furfurilactobacillus]QLE67386.1 DedA protein [Furfurilactobacillus rossiae]MCF6161533.1 VTT domain-containing protein [Furfurilactobacillus milii]MCF6163913.1 VTT domain-containing protein [Furfurilactobacillus milii]MCF6419442.1 VTT domain-containing protein [Furfurilactobacillus milii]MCH4011575.1 VTT domain-containing protein [Furfurilactobacillus sp.]